LGGTGLGFEIDATLQEELDRFVLAVLARPQEAALHL
jgi:hypothetical protein